MNITILTALFPLLASGFSAIAPHPHHPKSIVLGGAGGKVVVSYFTVPYNEKHLADLQPGFQWHLGFAQLETEVPLVVGDTQVPAGKYKLNASLGDGGAWGFELQDMETMEELQRAQRRARNSATAKAKFEKMKAEMGDSTIALGAQDFAMVREEHLSIIAMHRGFNRPDIQSEEPSSGIAFSLRVGFGDIHREIEFTETFEAAPAEASAKKQPKK